MKRTPTTPARVLFIGRGKVGRGLREAYRTHAGGATTRLRAHDDIRSGDVRWAELILLTVPDSAIVPCAEALVAAGEELPPVLHVSGNRPPTEASACPEHGALHPLLSFADAKRPPDVEDAYFAVAGTPAASRAGAAFAKACGAKVFTEGNSRRHATLQGAAYHAAAALAANGAAALATAAVGVLAELGVSESQARSGIAALLRSVANNVEKVGVPEALTGPVARGDLDTVREHRRALAALPPPAAEAYEAVAPAILACAAAAGLPARDVARLRRSLARPITAPRRSRSNPG